MAITYNLIPNSIKTLDVDGLIFPFNKGQIIPGTVSEYTQESFDETSNLNYALAMDMNDIVYNFFGDINSQVEDKIRGAESKHTDDGDRVGESYTLSWEIPAKTVEYTAYNGLTITLKRYGITLRTIIKYSKYFDLEGTYYDIPIDIEIEINGQPIKKGGDYFYLVDIEAKKYYSYSGSFYGKAHRIVRQNFILFIGGFYSDNRYAVGTILSYEAYYKGEMFFKTLDVSDYNNSLLTYDTLISNTKLNGNPVTVKPTETSFYIGFIFRNSSNVSNWYNSYIIARVGIGHFPGEIGGNTQTEYINDSCFGSYDETKLQNFFSTKNFPSEEMSPFEPSGGGGDPYEKDPDSQGNNDPGGHKGGEGKYQDIDEDVPIPGLPQISAVDTGLCTLLNPTNEQLAKLSDFLWSDIFSVDSFKKIFADPMDVILGLSIVPLKVASDTLRRINISGIDTGVEMYKCASQYIEVDCGSIDITNYWDNFMDYGPYTQYTIYLPYVGYKVLHADELVDKTITVKYHCDILSGACMAYVQCGKKVLYCFEGNISIQIPVTSASYDNMLHGMLQVSSGVGQIIAGGASMAAGGAGAGLMVSGAVGTATGATSAIKPTIGRSGNAESSTGLMGIQKPYLIISRPRAVVPSGLNKYSGYPAYKGGKLGDFNNFTVVQDIRIKNLNGATMEEMNEAERLCKEGVIV